MTHAESQDLLLDLAYGELDPERAAEVRSHLEGCAECRKEQEALDEARRLAAPFRELEEPSPGFDDRIRAAARAQAQLEHDGSVGKVIEVAGTVRPLGLDPARIDAHGPVKARPAERHRPRWVMRVAVGGSVAAAAALAMVVGNTLESRRAAELAEAARPQDFTIRAKMPASESVDAALGDAEAKREADARLPIPVSSPSPLAAALEKEKLAEAPGHKTRRVGTTRGSGGDAPAKAGWKDAASSVEAKRDDKGVVPVELPPSASFAQQPADRPPSPSAGIGTASSREQVASASPPAAAAAPVEGASRRSRVPPTPAISAPQRKEAETAVEGSGGQVGGRISSFASPAPMAGGIEADAQQARHAGNYALAASLYRQAAEMRRLQNDPAAAAWNLAHAVECLSAIAQFDEARRLRDDLAKLYPSEAAALTAARRALREVEPAAR